MRRLAFLIIGGAVFLLLGAMPALADGGPHVSTVNNGTTGITSDSCAGCHRAHTAQGPLLLVEDEATLCVTCHGDGNLGATTDVMNGVQYRVSTSSTAIRGSALLGALRSGGFSTARIDSGNAARLAYTSGTSVRQLAAVPVRDSGQAVTSTHLGQGVVWGNGPISASDNPGGDTTLTCTSCHNPHGNGQYRILNPIPVGTGGTATAAATGVNVTDAALPAAGDQRNYTVIQRAGPSYLLYAKQVEALSLPATAGDYFHKRVPWNGTASGTYNNDAPNGDPANFDTQINAWCSQCHTRYLALFTRNVTPAPYDTPSGDGIFNYRHSNTSDKPCTTCHVAHGSNAQMTGPYSATMEYPGGAAAPVGNSRLLKIDNRGTCQACHDPTGTITSGTYIGPVVVVP